MTDLNVDGAVREALVAGDGKVTVTGVVREALIDVPGTALQDGGLVREVVGAGVGQVRAGGLVREVVVVPSTVPGTLYGTITNTRSSAKGMAQIIAPMSLGGTITNTRSSAKGMVVISAPMSLIGTITNTRSSAKGMAQIISPSSFVGTITNTRSSARATMVVLSLVGGRITTRSFAKGGSESSLLFLRGRITATSKMPATLVRQSKLNGRISSTSSAYLVRVQKIALAGEITATSAIRRVDIFLLAGQITTRSSIKVNYPEDRTFIIAGIQQHPIPCGIVMLPTSEDVQVTERGGYGIGYYGFGAYGYSEGYVFASSQFYYIGEVYWGGRKMTEGVEWEYVEPFRHIIKTLPSRYEITTLVTLVFYRWDIGVRDGFIVTDYPVPFSFIGTTILADRIPAKNRFFTVEFTKLRASDNPRTMYTIFAKMVDDFLDDHTTYDNQGFETFRPVGYKVYDSTDNVVWLWDGTDWISQGQYDLNTYFYVKRLRQVLRFTGSGTEVVYTSGDGLSTLEEVITYPPFGEGVAKHFFEIAFSSDAQTQNPSAYQIAQHPGHFDPWAGT